MIPATWTVTTVLASAPATVNAFAPLLILVVSLGFGIWAVKRIPAMIKKARS